MVTAEAWAESNASSSPVTTRCLQHPPARIWDYLRSVRWCMGWFWCKVCGNCERSQTHTVTTIRLVCRERNIRVYQVRCKCDDTCLNDLECNKCIKMIWRSAGHLSRLWRLVGEVEAPNGCKGQCAIDVNANQMMLKQNRCKSKRWGEGMWGCKTKKSKQNKDPVQETTKGLACTRHLKRWNKTHKEQPGSASQARIWTHAVQRKSQSIYINQTKSFARRNQPRTGLGAWSIKLYSYGNARW